jgi:hypothetical protein
MAKKTEIEALVFDIGGIVVVEDVIKARQILCDKYNIEPEVFKDYAKRMLPLSYKGMLSGKDFFDRLLRESKINGYKAEELAEAWVKAREETSILNKLNIELIKDLGRIYNLFSFTNTTVLNDRTSQRKQAYELFLVNVKSWEKKHWKEEPEFYVQLVDEVENRTILPEKTLYVGKKAEYLELAKNHGFQVLQYKGNPAELRTDLKEMGVEAAGASKWN